MVRPLLAVSSIQGESPNRFIQKSMEKPLVNAFFCTQLITFIHVGALFITPKTFRHTPAGQHSTLIKQWQTGLEIYLTFIFEMVEVKPCPAPIEILEKG